MRGMNVCRTHGGATRQAQRAAQGRLASAKAVNNLEANEPDQMPGAALLDHARYVSRIEQELRPDRGSTPGAVDAWIRVSEYNRRLIETIAKTDPENVDIALTRRQTMQIVAIWKDVEERWRTGALEAIGDGEARSAFIRWWNDHERIEQVRQAFHTADISDT